MEWLKKEALWHIQYIGYIRVKISIHTLYTLLDTIYCTWSTLPVSLSFSVVALSVSKNKFEIVCPNVCLHSLPAASKSSLSDKPAGHEAVKNSQLIILLSLRAEEQGQQHTAKKCCCSEHTHSHDCRHKHTHCHRHKHTHTPAYCSWVWSVGFWLLEERKCCVH